MTMESLKIKVMGMSCDHCTQTIMRSVGAILGVQQVMVNLEKKEVRVDIDENQTNLMAITSKIVEVGFEMMDEKG